MNSRYAMAMAYNAVLLSTLQAMFQYAMLTSTSAILDKQ